MSSEASSTDSESDTSSITSDEPDDDDAAAESASIAPAGTSRVTNSESDRRSRSYAGRSRRQRDDNESDYSSSEEDEKQRGKSRGNQGLRPWESVFGFDTISLASIFSPGKEAMYRTKFELGIEELVFLGYPLCADSEGSWTEQKKRTFEGKSDAPVKEGGTLDGNLNDLLEEYSKMRVEDERTPEEKEAAAKSAGKQPKKISRLKMFHVVFVLNPPGLEYQTRVQEMFDYVVTEFSTALREEQERSDYVYKQAEMIIQMRDKASQDGSCIPSPHILSIAISKMASRQHISRAVGQDSQKVGSCPSDAKTLYGDIVLEDSSPRAES